MNSSETRRKWTGTASFRCAAPASVRATTTPRASTSGRINDYALPLEEARAQTAYGIHSGVNKVLIINREITPGRITVVLVDEVLGF